VCPASLRIQWAKEIAKHTDIETTTIKVKRQQMTVPLQSACAIINGTPARRKEQFRQALEDRPDYVIVSYATVLSDPRYIRRLKAGMVILDEASAIKSFEAQRTKKIKQMLRPDYRLGLTGTLVENRPEEAFCADEKTEILSWRGWLRYDQISIGDTVLTLNHTTGLSEWQQVKAVNVFPVVDQKMLLMEHRDHSSLTTMDHRWPVERVNKPGSVILNRYRTWATSEHFMWGDRVPITAECADIPSTQVNADALVELVAWLYTEGHIRKHRDGSLGTAVYIAQNTGTLGEKRIRSALTNMFGPANDLFPRTGAQKDTVPRWRFRLKRNGRATEFVLNTLAGSMLLEHAPEKVPSRAFISSLTANQLELFIETSIMADNNGEHWFSQKNPNMAEAFQFACILAGYGTAIRLEPKISYDRNGNPYRMTVVTIRRRKYFSPGQSPRLGSTVAYTGNVWCPTTSNGTWFARRNGTTYFTGNSIMQWVDDSVLGREDFFEKAFIVRDRYGTVKRYKNLPLFHKRLSQAMSRVDRSDPNVSPYLPETDTDDWEVEMHPSMWAAYRYIAEDLLSELQAVRRSGEFDARAYYAGQANENTGLGRVMSRIMALEMLLDHPSLIVKSADDYVLSEKAIDGGKRRAVWPGSAYCHEVAAALAGIEDGQIKSAKLIKIKEMVDLILDHPNSKILIFSRFREMLNVLEQELDHSVVQYHGGLSSADKAVAVERFQKEPDLRVLLSSHAGAYGTDMKMANYLINYDQAQSAGRQDQINGRHVRASSEFDRVYIRNLITVPSIEERNRARLDYKRSLARAVVDGVVDRSGRIENDLATLTEFLESSL